MNTITINTPDSDEIYNLIRTTTEPIITIECEHLEAGITILRRTVERPRTEMGDTEIVAEYRMGWESDWTSCAVIISMRAARCAFMFAAERIAQWRVL